MKLLLSQMPDPSRPEYSGVTFTSRPEVLADVQFTDCTFLRIDLQGADLSGSSFIDCHFDGCNLSLARVTDARFRSAVFHKCKLVGIDFLKCDRRFSTFEAFEGCTMRSCNLSELKLAKVTFRGSEVIECDFKNVDLLGADFRQTDLQGSLFHAADLQRAHFEGARNYSISPLANTLKGAKFELPEALSFLAFFDIEVS